MPKLSEIYGTKLLVLDVSKVSIQMKQDMSWEAGQKLNDESDKTKAGQELIVSLIESWDLMDENGEIFPISLPNLSKLPVKDVVQIMGYAQNLATNDIIKPNEPKVEVEPILEASTPE